MLNSKGYSDSYLMSRVVYTLCALWLFTAGATFGYAGSTLFTSDIVSGVFLVLASWALTPPHERPPIAFVIIVGLWLVSAPIMLLAKQPVAYVTDTMIGSIVIIISSFLAATEQTSQHDGDTVVPQGMSYNPSALSRRVPVILLAFIAYCIARYLAAYQLGYIQTVWDPVFIDGTKRVLTSQISRTLPIPDAGLGSIVYLLEVLLELSGSSQRWHRQPWLVLLLAINVLALAVVSLVLMLMQPLVVGAWCFFCLVLVGIMLGMVPLIYHEVLATFRLLLSAPARSSFWKTLFNGSDSTKFA